MAVRYAADGRDHTRALALGATSQISLAFWGYQAVDRNAFTTYFYLGNGTTSDFIMLQTADDGVSLALHTESTSVVILQTVAIGTWYYFGISLNGTASTITIRPENSSTFNTYTPTMGASSTNITTLQLGESPFGSEWINGRLAAFKIWHGVTLNLQQLQAESYSYQPRRLANLVAWYPFLRAETTDFSGNGNTLSGGTGTTTEDGPPISWGSPNPFTYAPTANVQTLGLGLASETSTTKDLGSQRARTLEVAGDTANALVLDKSKTQGVGIAGEIGSSHSLTRAKRRVLGVDGSTDSASRLGRVKSVGLASDTSSVLETGKAKRLDLGQAVGSETALDIGRAKRRVLETVGESSTSLSLGMLKSQTLSLTGSVETALQLTRSKTLALGTVDTTETALVLLASKTLLLGLPVELSTSLALGKSKIRALGLVESVDSARSLGEELGLASDTNIVHALAKSKHLVLGLASSNTDVLGLGKSKVLALGITSDSNSLESLIRTKANLLGITSDSTGVNSWNAGKSKLLELLESLDTVLAMGGGSVRVDRSSPLTDSAGLRRSTANRYRRT